MIQMDDQFGLAHFGASIVPLPFGSGYQSRRGHVAAADFASIVPLPFGSGYEPGRKPARRYDDCFNCAAPFRERLFGVIAAAGVRGTASIVPLPFGSGYRPGPPTASPQAHRFNCAAPFRERLFIRRLRLRRGGLPLQLCRSLSGAVIASYIGCRRCWHRLQLCRSLSGAVMLRLA